MTAKAVKIAIVNSFDVMDVTNWSGIPLHIYQKISAVYGKENIQLFNIPFRRNWVSKLRGLYFNRIKKQNYLSDFDNAVMASSYSEYKAVREGGYDFILTFQFFMVPNVWNGRSKIIFWSDATFKNLLNYYGYVSNLPAYTLKHGQQMQKEAFEKCSAIILSSDWAAQSAIEDYGAPPQKVSIIPFASNFNSIPDAHAINQVISNRSTDTLKLLFIGVDWERKGGDKAVTLVNNLNKAGIKAVLQIVGTEVPSAHQQNPYLEMLGFINKNKADGEQRLAALFTQANYLVLPTIADCTPVVFSEANAYGLPVISSNVGGIASVVINDVNGACFSLEAFDQKALAFIQKYQASPQAYQVLCQSSFEFYQRELSWQNLLTKFEGIVTRLLEPEAVA